MSPILYCPECRSEYLGSAIRCADCDVALVEEAALDAAGATEEMPPAARLTCVRAASLGWASALSERLREAGISHRIEAAADDDDGSVRRPGANLPYGVYVREEDAAAAARVDDAFMRSQIPDLPAAEAADGGPPGGEGCPACGADLVADAAECPDCGLALALGE